MLTHDEMIMTSVIDKARKTKSARNPAESREEAWSTSFLLVLRQNQVLQTPVHLASRTLTR